MRMDALHGGPSSSDCGRDKGDDAIGAGVDGSADDGYIEDVNGRSYVTYIVGSVQS